MVSIIKNQLLKHLSRYTKNLSSDKINLSTFRGEGELSNLQLDENVLTELLELPSWLRLTSAWCNHVSFRIHWTKLKSTPITLSLDEVNITVETCEFGRGAQSPPSGVQPITAPQGKYSFIHKVIDGITITVNTVNVKFQSPAFTASVQMSRIRVESKTPKWLHGDLRVTRLKDPARGLILIFKELSWQTVRIEASSTQDKNLTPLRLLTNQARCRITIKKKLSDCSVLSSRLVLILDDLLWVLTDSQLKAALHFADSLSGLIKASTHVTQKTKAQKKLENLPEYQAQVSQQSRHHPDLVTISSAQKSFNIFDVQETSYHFFSQRIDLHLCDDAGDGRSSHPDLKDGGALQVSVQGFQIDYYPYHLAKANRSHWPKYKEAAVPPALWLEQSLNVFRESLLNLTQPNRPPTHQPLERATNQPNLQQQQQQHHQVPGSAGSSHPQSPTAGTPGQSPGNRVVMDKLAKLMTSCVILRVEDFTMYRVTTSGKKQMPKEFISGDKDRFSFPPDLPTLHAEFTYFYYPGDYVYPLPPSKAYVYVNPVQIHFDLDSVLWFNSFALNLHESLLRTSVADSMSSGTPTNEPSLMYMDVKLEAIMPRILLEASAEAPVQRDRPKTMQVQISRFAVTNIREMGSSRADLAQALHSLQEGSLVFASGFPSKSDDLCIVTDRILSHVAATDVSSSTNTTNSPEGAPLPNTSFSSNTIMSRYALWDEPRDVWCCKIDPIWIDFFGAKALGQNKAMPFIDAVPITLWLHGKNVRPEKFIPPMSPSNVASINNSRDLVLNVKNLQQLDMMSESGSKALGSNVTLNSKASDESMEKKPKSDETVVPEEEDGADLHIIAHVSNLISVQIDHYQYLFLLRLSETMTELSTFLTIDANRILQKQTPNKSIVIGCVIPQVEVTLVMPSQTPGKESSGGDAESVVPDSASLGDDLHYNAATWQSSINLDHIKSTPCVNTNPFGSVETPSPINEMPAELVPQNTSNPNTHGHNVSIQSTPTLVSGGAIPRQQEIPSGSSSGSSSRRNRNSVSDGTFSKEINSSLISMKKGFTSFMTSIDSALKTNPNDDASDTFSIHSDISSDSENFIMVLDSDKTADCMDVMFRLNPFTNDNNIKVSPVEVASEVCEELPYKTNMSSPSEPSDACSWRRRDLVSMATFRLTTVELIRQNKGYDSSLKLQVSAISCNECGAIPWDELQTKFGARCRAWNVAPYNPEAPPIVQLRLEETLNPPENICAINDKNDIKGWFDHNVDVRVKDLNMDLTMSTIIGLGDLAEDEVITKPMPMSVLLENLKINLIEDRPPVNITSPGPVPINLAIGCLKMKRDATGIFQIQPVEIVNLNDGQIFENPVGGSKKMERDRELISLQLVMQQMKMDNENLKKQLVTSEQNSEICRTRGKQDSDMLRSYLKEAQDEIGTLLDEKRTLLDTVRSLQQQLVATERNIKNDGNR